MWEVSVADQLVNAVIAIITGVALWLALPRGATLARRRLHHDWAGQPLQDTWELTNDSAVAVQVLSAAVEGVSTYDEASGRFESVPIVGAAGVGIPLIELTDSSDEITRRERDGGAWTGVVLLPGDGIRVQVLNNTTFTVRYRRAGAFGLLERRALRVHGGI